MLGRIFLSRKYRIWKRTRDENWNYAVKQSSGCGNKEKERRSRESKRKEGREQILGRVVTGKLGSRYNVGARDGM